ncbi:MAG: pyridoxal-phosphate dependent enzyme [Alphaproteobacteria bacterium]|nr:MAG: pyridoxal-phosphate dependent enzyme [Alphaproteobacteria bacterium]
MPPGRAEIAAARARIAPHVRRTPMLAVEPGALAPAGVALKLEHTQITGSFKVRGAFNTLLSADPPPAAVVCASGGNHGAAVAHAARRLGLPATVFVPAAIADPVKIRRMEDLGARVRLVEGDVDSVLDACLRHAEESGALFVHPYDAPATLAGQGTLGAEIEEDLPDIDTLLVAVGGGGLLGGIAAWFAGRIRIVAVETEGTASLARTLAQGRRARITPRGLAASALGAQSIGELPLAVLARHPVESVVVPDAALPAAQARLWEACRQLVEPGAAAALAALVSGAWRPAGGERVAVLLCGGNAAPGWSGAG